MKSLIIYDKNSKKALTVSKEIENLLSDISINCYYYSDKTPQTGDCDFAVSVGGDGTLLYAAHLLLDTDIPIVGVNVGRLGFLTAVGVSNISKLKQIKAQDYFVDKRMLLSATSNENTVFTALNEFVIASGTIAKTVDVEVYCDNVRVQCYRGDGVIISTPTGSTAYSMSAGGPITDATLDAIIVTPLCAHSLNAPPMVFSQKRSISVRFNNRGGKLRLCADGAKPQKIDNEIIISKSNKNINLIYFNNAEQFSAIDEKLRRC